MKKIKLTIIFISLTMLIGIACTGCGSSDKKGDGYARIPGGGNYDSSDDSSGSSRTSKNKKKATYTIIVMSNSGEVLEDASVNLGGTINKTGQNGSATFERPSGKNLNLIVSCENYATVEYKGYNLKEKATDTITLRSISSEKHRLNKAIYRGKTRLLDVDLLDGNKRLYSSAPNYTFSIETEVIGDEDTVREFCLCQKIVKDGAQRENVIARSYDGNFKNIAPKDFQVGAGVYIKVIDVYNLSCNTAINLEIAKEPTYMDGASFNLFGDSFSVNIDDDVPIFGGTTFSFDNIDFPVYTTLIRDEEGNPRLRVGLNISKEVLSSKERLKTYQKNIDDLEKVKSNLSSYESTVKNLRGFQAKKSEFNMSGFTKPEVVFNGYVEAGFNSLGEISNGTGKASLIIKQTVCNWNWQYFIMSFPLTVNVKGVIEADVSGAIVYDVEDNKFVGGDVDVTSNINPSITVKAGAGFPKLSAGIYGDAELDIDFVWVSNKKKTGFEKVDIISSIGIYANALLFNAEKPLRTNRISLFSRSEKDSLKKNPDSMQAMSINDGNNNSLDYIYDASNYTPEDKAQGEEYVTVQNKVYGSSGTELNEKTILGENVSTGSQPVAASNGKHAMTVFCSYKDMENTEYPYSKLYYSVNTNGVWQNSVAIDNNISNEMTPQIVNNGDDYYILYQDSDFDYSLYNGYEAMTDEQKDELMKQFTNSVDLHVIKYNAVADEFTDLGKIITENEYDYLAQIDVVNNSPVVYWVKNDGDLLGTDIDTVNTIMRAGLASGSWKINEIKNTFNPVTVVEAGTYNGISSCMYTIDEDGDVTNEEGTVTYIYDNSENMVTDEMISDIKYTRIPSASEGKFYILIGDNLYDYVSGQLNIIAEHVNEKNSEFSITDTGIYFVGDSNDATELFFKKRGSDSEYSSPVPVTSDNRWLRNLNMITLNDSDVAVALSDEYKINDDGTSDIHSTLVAYQIGDFYDIAIDGATFINDTDSWVNENIKKEDYNNTDDESEENNINKIAEIPCTITNKGTNDIEDYEIVIKGNDGEELTILNDYSKIIKSGESINVTLDVGAPESVSYGKWTLECKIKNKIVSIDGEDNNSADEAEDNITELNYDNNNFKIQAGASDFDVKSSLHNASSYPYLLVEVRNTGELTDTTRYSLVNAGDTTKEYATREIENLEPGDVEVFKINLKNEWFDDNGKVSLLSKVLGASYEYDDLNNYSYEYASKNYGQYNINYELNGGTNSSSNPETYVTTDSFTLYAPYKTDYSFGGWYTTSDFANGSSISKVESGTAGDITLYAKWELRPSTKDTSKSSGTKDSDRSSITQKGNGTKKSGNTSSSVKSAKKPGRVVIKSVKNKRKRKVIVKWKKISKAKGYIVQYSTNKKFKKKSTYKVKVSKTKVTINKLKKKQYYIRIRAYRVVNKKKIYGKWSKKMMIKIKV